jgi:hypothetical protein
MSVRVRFAGMLGGILTPGGTPRAFQDPMTPVPLGSAWGDRDQPPVEEPTGDPADSGPPADPNEEPDPPEEPA